jgi:hypothetical protein
MAFVVVVDDDTEAAPLLFVAVVGEVVCGAAMDDDMEFSGMDDQSISSSSPRCRCHRRALPLLVSPPPSECRDGLIVVIVGGEGERARQGRASHRGGRDESRIRAGRRRLRVSEQEPTSTRAAATMIAAVVVAQATANSA